MEIERRPQSPLPSILPALQSAEEALQAAGSAAGMSESSLVRLEKATETLMQAVQKLHDAFSDISGLLTREQVVKRKSDSSQQQVQESGEARQRMREARRNARQKANKKAGRPSDAQDNRKSGASAKTSGGDNGARPQSGAAPSTSGAAQVAASSSAQGGDPVDRLIDYTARNEGGGRYDAWNPNDNGAGVSFGLIQFNQKKGSLPSLMQRMHAQDPAKFDQIFGPHAQNLQNPSWVRNANLNDPDLKSRMQTAGRDPELQRVQRDLAREGYYNPAARLAEAHGLNSERGHAMAFDIAVQYGVGGLGDKLQQAAAGGGGERAILTRLANLADTHGYDANRRHRILADPNLSDGPVGSVPAPAPAPQPGQGGSYTVQPGDTLSAIAARHGTTWQELARINNISNPDIIHPGQQLRLPGGAPDPGQTTPAPAPPAPAPPAPAPTPPVVPPAPPAASFDWPELQNGSKGPHVSELQQALARAGYDPGPVDGDFGPKTQAAVRRFQQEHGCDVDGVVGPQTRGALAAALGGAPKPGQTPAPAPPSAPAPAPAPPSAPAPAPPPASGPSFNWPQMQRGSKGGHVSELQQVLARAGYDPGPVDGDFGPRTEGAVRRFQQDHGCAVDGIVGPQTRGALSGVGPGRPGPSVPAPNIPPGHYDGTHPAPGTTNPAAWIAANPPLTNQPGDRSASNYSQVVNQFAVGHNPRYAVGHQGRGETYCNIFVWDVTSAMGAEIPHYINGRGDRVKRGEGYEIDANSTVDWLHRRGNDYGWRRASAEEAQSMANAGHPATVVWKNPGGIGHVAIVRPGDINANGPSIAQAGGTNTNSTHVRNTFGNRPVEYWVHD